MADNTQLPIPSTSGDIVATDDIGGVKYQRVKITLGADGVDDGDVSGSNALPVTGTFYQATQPISAASLPLPTGAATEATLSTLNGKIPAVGQTIILPPGYCPDIDESGPSGIRVNNAVEVIPYTFASKTVDEFGNVLVVVE